MYGVSYLVIITNLIRKETWLMTDKTSTHRTIILRCWSEEDELAARRFWRFHAHWLDTDDHQSFADVETLLNSLGDVFGSEVLPFQDKA